MKAPLLLATALTVLAGSAQAADLIVDAPVAVAPAAETGLYLSLHGGFWAPETADATFILSSPVDVEFSSGTGYRLGGAIGIDVTPNLSLEGEVSYASTGLETIAIGSDTLDLEGDVSTLSLMANAIVGADLDGWRPYVGVGVGAVHMSLDVPLQNVPGSNLSDDTWTWGAQLLAGVEFAVTEDVSLGARYRYQLRGDTEFADTDSDPVTIFSSAAQGLELTAKFAF